MKGKPMNKIDNKDVYDIADVLINHFNDNLAGSQGNFPVIEDPGQLAEVLDNTFDPESLWEMMLTDFTKGMVFGFACAIEMMREEEEDLD